MPEPELSFLPFFALNTSFDLEQLMGGGNSKKENEPGGDPGEDPDDDPEEGNKNSFNIGDLLSSFMGGESKPNYLLTPPLMVKDGEKLEPEDASV